MKNKRLIVIVSILSAFFLIVILSILLLPKPSLSPYGSGSGWGSGYSQVPPPDLSSKCRDSDSNATYPNGLNYYKRGIADARDDAGVGIWHNDSCRLRVQGQYAYVPECSGNNCTLREGYCSTQYAVSRIDYECPFGCKNGACIRKIQPDCCIKILINESKEDDNIIFSIISVNSIECVVPDYQPSFYPEETPYILSTIDLNGVILNNYNLQSSRFLLYDNPDGQSGGVIELDEGISEIIIPLDSSAKKILINYSDNLTSLFLPEDLTCPKGCLIKNETGIYYKEYCCAGLTPIQKNDTAFTCSLCGDSLCENYENRNICPEDCK